MAKQDESMQKGRPKNSFTDMWDTKATTLDERINELLGEGVMIHYRENDFGSVLENIQLDLSNSGFKSYLGGIEYCVGNNSDALGDACWNGVEDKFNRFLLIPEVACEGFYEFYIRTA